MDTTKRIFEGLLIAWLVWIFQMNVGPIIPVWGQVAGCIVLGVLAIWIRPLSRLWSWIVDPEKKKHRYLAFGVVVILTVVIAEWPWPIIQSRLGIVKEKPEGIKTVPNLTVLDRVPIMCREVVPAFNGRLEIFRDEECVVHPNGSIDVQIVDTWKDFDYGSYPLIIGSPRSFNLENRRYILSLAKGSTSPMDTAKISLVRFGP